MVSTVVALGIGMGPAEENKTFREKLAAYLQAQAFSGESVTLLPEKTEVGLYILQSVRNCRNASSVPRELFSAAAPKGHADKYLALTNSTIKCVDEPFVRRSCVVTGALGGKLPVSNERSARKIFLSAEDSLKPDANRAEFPDVEVVDYGDHWGVFRGRIPKRFLFWRESVNFGGGQLSMYIDKCDGTLSGITLSE